MKFLREDILEKKGAFMLRQPDGKLLKCSKQSKAHPYIISDVNNDDEWEELDDLVGAFQYDIEWFYKNTLKQRTKEDIKVFWCYIKTHQQELGFDEYNLNINIPCDKSSFEKANNMDEEEFIELFYSINGDTNQEFCRVRMGGLYDSDEGKGEIFFRISSIGFNWFRLIWGLVYKNRNIISNVTITHDWQSGTDSFADSQPLRHNGISIDHLPVDEFINLSGTPDLSSYNIHNKNNKTILEE